MFRSVDCTLRFVFVRLNNSQIFAAIIAAAMVDGGLVQAQADEFERAPINYSNTPPANAVSQLQERIASGAAQLAYEEEFGYLRALLRELKVPESSQMLVFSKTSLQRHRISPQTPRALYFNDEMYVGYCRSGDVLEISAADPQFGTVFYTLDQQAVEKPQFVRQGDSCLTCHSSSHTQGVPGHLVRSVFPDSGGFPILSSGTFRIDQTSPLRNRWGGWYVTGTHGGQPHLGNLIVRGTERPEELDLGVGANLTDLGDRIERAAYLSPHSDIVALLVLEHQAAAHNLITRARFQTQLALYQEAALNRELRQPSDQRWESTTRRIQSVGESLVKYLLFSGEAQLTAPIHGTSHFEEEFIERGLRDERGRSLRDFDLTRRLFKYPCSYLIYSPSFDALPNPVKDYVLRRLWEVLGCGDSSPEFVHLTPPDRRAIVEILRSTKPDLPEYWEAEKLDR